MARVSKGKSFSFNSDDIERIASYLNKQNAMQTARIQAAVTKGTNLAYQIAHQKRPYISKTEMKSQRRSFRVSDPNAKLGVPVAANNGGALQASIQKTIENKTGKSIGQVWTDSPYAKYLEYGTSRMAARPFMRPALALVQEAIKSLVKVR